MATNAPAAGGGGFDLKNLIDAGTRNTSSDVFRPSLTPDQWQLLSTYLQPVAVRQGQVLIQQGAVDRTVYLVEAGTLTVHFEDAAGHIRLASVGEGSAVGEGAFFSRLPRNATVQAATPCRLWSLTAMRFTELSNRQPQIALEVAMALGALVSRRLGNRPKRIAVT